MDYEVAKSVTGKAMVKYQCRKCHCSLMNPLAKAGQDDHCPECRTVHQVPGQKELQLAQKAQANKEAYAAQQAAQLKEQREQERKEAKEKAARIEARKVKTVSLEPLKPIVNTAWFLITSAVMGFGACFLLVGFVVIALSDGTAGAATVHQQIAAILMSTKWLLVGISIILMIGAGTLRSVLAAMQRQNELTAELCRLIHESQIR